MKQYSPLEWINLTATILGPLLIGWGIWSVNIRLENAHLLIQQEISDKYVTKSWFISTSDETNRRIDKLSDKLDAIGVQVSDINTRTKRIPVTR